MTQLLEAVLETLEKLAQQVRGHGPIAPERVTLGSTTNTAGTQYAVLRGDVGNGRKSMSLGKYGSDRHIDWQLRIHRRNLLQEIERRTQVLQQWIDSPLELPTDISEETDGC